MNSEEIKKYINGVISKKIKKNFKSDYNIIRDQYEKWDSLIQIELIFHFEEYFEISFSENEIEKMDSSNEITEIILKNMEK